MAPLDDPFRTALPAVDAPVKDKLVPVAAPITGVMRVGVFARTVFPEPVLVLTDHVPELINGVPVELAVLSPVPP
jgi:hypothetical protein